MSDKFFFNGKPPKKGSKSGVSYSDNRESKPGTKDFPIAINAQTEARKIEIEAILLENGLFATITVDADVTENITALDSLINTTKTIVVEKVPKRNEPCSCGSGKKYKKCCG